MLTQEEIDDLVRSPRERFDAALRSDDAAAAQAVYASIEQAYQARPPGDRASSATVAGFVHERHGDEGLRELPSVTEWLAVVEHHRLRADDFKQFMRSWRPEVDAAIDAGDINEALALYDYVVDGFKRVHDAYLDWFAVVLSHVYRRYGVDEVEALFRRSGGHTKEFVEASMRMPPDDRARMAAHFLTGNFGTISAINEYDDRYEVVQSTCGSCGRHAAETEASLAPLDLAVVTERHPLTFNRGQTPVYRTHVAVLHYLLPMEQTGVPCPVVRCPDGLVAGPCTVVIYKDPLDRRAKDEELVKLLGG